MKNIKESKNKREESDDKYINLYDQLITEETTIVCGKKPKKHYYTVVD